MEEDAIYYDAGEERQEVAERYNTSREVTLQSAQQMDASRVEETLCD